MNFYLVDKIGDGSEENSIRPNITDGVSFVCSEVGNSFLVGTNETLLEETIIDLEGFCRDKGLLYEDVLKWFVGDN